jgi:MOSC domain-containing protein YiiM
VDFSFRFDFWWNRLPASPSTAGTVEGLVVRPGEGERERRTEIEVDVETGIVGDRWELLEETGRANQVALINVHVLRSLANGDPERMARSGDNLHVDLDLSEENLPPGAHLTVGQVVLRVSEMPHRPCLNFSAAFGPTASKKVARAGRRGLRGRGVLCEVMQGGRLQVGDKVYVRRPGDWTKND